VSMALSDSAVSFFNSNCWARDRHLEAAFFISFSFVNGGLSGADNAAASSVVTNMELPPGLVKDRALQELAEGSPRWTVQ